MHYEAGKCEKVRDDDGLWNGALVLKQHDRAVQPAELRDCGPLLCREVRAAVRAPQVTVPVVRCDDVVVDELLPNVCWGDAVQERHLQGITVQAGRIVALMHEPGNG